MILVKSDKTAGMRAVGKKNEDKVKKWFLDNPGHSISECSRSLNLTWQTVKKHVVSIQKGE